MCLAIYKPKNAKMPTAQTIKTAWAYNPHGAGLAILFPDHVHIVKGLMKLDDLLAILPTIDTSLEVVIHLRYSTSGKIEPAMCHPFPIEHDAKKYRMTDVKTQAAVIHNGVMFQPRLNFVSDTAIFSRFLALNKTLCDKTLKRIVGSDRLALVSVESGVKLVGDWTQRTDGLFYSNTYSLVSHDRFSSKRDAWDNSFSWASDDYFHNGEDDASELEFCPCCDSQETYKIGLQTETYECAECGTVYNASEYLNPSDDFKTYLDVGMTSDDWTAVKRRKY